MNLIKLIDKFNKSTKGKILSSIFVFFMSVVMVVSVCFAYAWFAKNTNTDSTGLQITTTVEDINATYTSFYIEDLDTKAVEKGSQYNNASGEATLDINMLPYDMTFTSTNQYAPVVVRIQIYDIPSQFIPESGQTKYVSLIFSRDTSVSFSSDSELDAYFSSIGQIGCYANSTLSLDASNETIYDGIIAQYRADNSVQKFTTYSDSTELYSKVSFLDISVAYTSANFKTDSNSKSCLVVYVCFDYNASMANAYAVQQNEDLSNVNSLEQNYDITNDITAITVDFN